MLGIDHTKMAGAAIPLPVPQRKQDGAIIKGRYMEEMKKTAYSKNDWTNLGAHNK